MQILELLSNYYIESLAKDDGEKVTEKEELIRSKDSNEGEDDLQDLDSGIEHSHAPLLLASGKSNWVPFLVC